MFLRSFLQNKIFLFLGFIFCLCLIVIFPHNAKADGGGYCPPPVGCGGISGGPPVLNSVTSRCVGSVAVNTLSYTSGNPLVQGATVVRAYRNGAQIALSGGVAGFPGTEDRTPSQGVTYTYYVEENANPNIPGTGGRSNSKSVRTASNCGGGGSTQPPTSSFSVVATASGCNSDGLPRISASWSGGKYTGGVVYVTRIDALTGTEELVSSYSNIYNIGSGSVVDMPPVSGRVYRYRVSILYSDLTSQAPITSSNVTAPTCTTPPPPPPPTISATTTASTCSGTTPRVRIAWTTVSSAASYRIEKVAGGNTQTENLSAAQAASSGYALTQNTAAGSNYHRVYALNSSGTTLANTTTAPVNIASCPAPPVDPVYSFIVDPPTAELDSGGNREFIAHARVDGSRISGSIGLTWSISDPSLGTLSEATENSSRTTIFTATSNCTLLQSDRTVVLTARAAINNRTETRTSTITINACNQSGSGSADTTTINGLIIGNQIELDGSNISIIYDGRIITNPPLGFSEIIVPTIREGR